MTVTYRRAREADLAAIVALLADDVLGASREAGDTQRYHQAFDEIRADGNQFLCVVDDDGEVVGTLQLSFIPGLARGGAKRGQIEAVRIASHRRSEGLGEKNVRLGHRAMSNAGMRANSANDRQGASRRASLL